MFALLAAPFRSNSHLEAEIAALRRAAGSAAAKVKGRVAISNGGRLFFVKLYLWFPSILEVITIIGPRRWCAGIERAFVVIGARNHGDAAGDCKFRLSCVR